MLSRMLNEVVVLTMPDGRLIRVVICDLRGDKARIGFDAPADVRVDRLEVHEAIQREKLAGLRAEPNESH